TGRENVIYGGKHAIYIQNSRYDSGRAYLSKYTSTSTLVRNSRFNDFVYVAVPLLNSATNAKLKPLSEGIIPSDVRIQIRIARPYIKYNTKVLGGELKNDAFPLYYFSMKDMAPVKLSDNPNADKQVLLDKIHAVPNPYYGYTGYE